MKIRANVQIVHPKHPDIIILKKNEIVEVKMVQGENMFIKEYVIPLFYLTTGIVEKIMG